MNDDEIRVLLVEDNPDDVRIVRRMLRLYDRARFTVFTADSTELGLQKLASNGADVLMLDYRLSGEDGLAFLQREVARRRLPPVVMVTGQGSEHIAVQAIRAGARSYIPKDSLTPTRLGDCLREALESFRHEDELSRFDEQIMVALASAADGNDGAMGRHLRRLAQYSLRLGQALDIDEAQLSVLRCGALLHDIGKLAVSPAILHKAGPLSEEEWEEVRQHPIVGERICSCLSSGGAGDPPSPRALGRQGLCRRPPRGGDPAAGPHYQRR